MPPPFKRLLARVPFLAPRGPPRRAIQLGASLRQATQAAASTAAASKGKAATAAAADRGDAAVRRLLKEQGQRRCVCVALHIIRAL